MQIGIISDIHGNLDALDVILHAFKEKKVDKIICLGDMIGYFHQSIEVLDRLIDLDVSAICGNHEAYILGYLSYPHERSRIYNIDYVQQLISPQALQWLTSLPKSLTISIQGKKYSFFHGSPWDPLLEYVYPDYPDFKKFLMIDSDLFFLGHTHYSLYKKIENKIIINPGSVGLPRNGDKRAHAAILNTQSGIEFIQEDYNIPAFLESARNHEVHKTAIQRLIS